MCGIAGCWKNFDKGNSSLVVTQDLLKSIEHRGPDGEGFEVFDHGRLVLGHRRLSILDLSQNGKQPMSHRNRWSITYNGEIYNFLEIRSELESKGYYFSSGSDTEVILAAYSEWGKDCVNRFNGMWAFAIWDKLEQSLFLSRDRFGVKPLYFHFEKGKRFAFASEIKAFRESCDFSTSLDPEKILCLLHEPNCLDPYGFTPYSQIKILTAGTSLKAYKGLEKLEVYRWWKLKENPIHGSEEELQNTFTSILGDACKLRMRSDAPLATALSGGLDSSSIYATIRSINLKNGGLRLAPGRHGRCFTMSFPNSSDDELEFAQQVAGSYRETCQVAKNNIEKLPDQLAWITHHYGDFSPNPLLSLAPIYRLMAERSIKVSIDGHGGDECLLGYPDMIASLLRIAKDEEKEGLENTLSGMLHNPNYDPTNHHVPLTAKARIALGRAKQILRPRKKPLVQQTSSGSSRISREDFQVPDSVIEYRNELKELKQSVFGIHKASIEYEKLPLILRNFDKSSMLSGVEIRAPFLDYRLVEFCCNLPLKQKVNLGYSKFILRQTMDSKIPKEIVWRKHKIGINAPLQNWFCDEKFIKFSKEKIDQISTYVKPLLNNNTRIDSLFDSSKHDSSLTWFFMNFAILNNAP